MICLTTLVSPPHTGSLFRSLVPSITSRLARVAMMSGGGVFEGRGASVCSVTTVIVKQQAQGGPLLRYSQKAVAWGGGEGSALL